jgi:hypothetical protein
MKKRTKKKLVKYSKKAGVGLLKLAFVYPYRGIKYLINKKSKDIDVNTSIAGSVKHIPKFKALVEVKKLEGDYDSFKNLLNKGKSTIGLVLGARGTGKSAIGMKLVENLKITSKKNLYALGFQPDSLPDWITVVKDINQIKTNSFVLIDEGGIEFSSRKSMSKGNTLLSDILMIARHKDLSVLFITQNSSNLEINVIRQSDYLLLKPSSLMQKDFERAKIQNIYKEVDKEFKELKDKQGITYVYSNGYRGFITNSLPSFWTEKVSKSYRGK